MKKKKDLKDLRLKEIKRSKIDDKYDWLIGKLEVKINDFWLPISNLGFDYFQTQLLCKHFGYNGGYEYVFDLFKKKQLVLISISCKNVTSFRDCIILDFNEIWLNRFNVPHLRVKCFNNEIS